MKLINLKPEQLPNQLDYYIWDNTINILYKSYDTTKSQIEPIILNQCIMHFHNHNLSIPNQIRNQINETIKS